MLIPAPLAVLPLASSGTTVAVTATGPRWSVIVRLAAVDISDQTTGQIEVEGEESAARLARVTIIRDAGLAIDLFGLTGQAVEIDYQPYDVGGTAETPVRVFTGVVDVARFDPDSGTIALDCTDARQSALDALDRAAIDALTPGALWHAWVDDEDAQGLDYAEARLASLPASLDRSATGAWRLTPWAAGVPTVRFNDDSAAGAIDDASLSVEISEREQRTNRVTCTMQYRYPRLAERRAVYAWSVTLTEVVCDVCSVPTRQSLLDAIEGSGLEVVNASFTDLWPAQIVICGGPVLYVNNDPTRQTMQAASVSARRRYAQDIDEEWSLVVESPASLAVAGVQPDELRGAGQVDYDTDLWVRDATLAPLPVFDGASGEAYVAMTGRTEDGRAVADAALSCLLAQARVAILAAHRRNRVRFTTPLDPRLDLPLTVEVATARVSATGKIGHILHRVDIESGEATTEVTLYLSSAAPAYGAVTETPRVPPAPPAIPDPDIAPDSLDVTLANYYDITPADDSPPGYYGSTGFDSGSSEFHVASFAVADADTQSRSLAVGGTYAVAIPEDPLVLVS